MNLLQHIPFMTKAMALAEKGRGTVSPNPVVGAVLVRKGMIIAEDWHRKFGEGHAEWNLLSNVKRNTDNVKINASDTLYVTLEPCCHINKKTPPCTDIILEKGVKKVVVGLLDPNPEVSGKGIKFLRKKGVEVIVMEEHQKKPLFSIPTEVEESLSLPPLRDFSASFSFAPPPYTTVPATENFGRNDKKKFNLQIFLDELRWQNRFFFKWVRERKPWVSVKIAQSLDGRVAEERGKQLWLTGEDSRAHVHQVRAHYDAILVGVKTVIADNPRLTVRDKKGKAKRIQPKAVVLDAALSIPMTSEVVRKGTILFRGRQFQRRSSRKAQLIEKGVEVLEVDTTESGYLHLGQVLDELAARGITSLYVEGGPSVWSSFFKEGLVDEVMFYFAPKFLGGGVESLELGDGSSEFGVKKVQFREMKVLGRDVYWQGAF